MIKLIREKVDRLAADPLRLRHHNATRQVPSPRRLRPPTGFGTDDQARDVLARIIYGFPYLGAVRPRADHRVVGGRGRGGRGTGDAGGYVDLGMQRFIEIWSGLPVLYLLIILATFVQPDFWWLLGLMLLFSWTTLVDVVRAEFLRTRNFDYVRAARAWRRRRE